MIYCRFSNGKATGITTYEFSLKDTKRIRLRNDLYEDDLRITISDEDYVKINTIFHNIRKIRYESRCTWFGDEAKFILWNLLELVDLGYFDD